MKKITEQPAWSLAARHVEIRAALREAVEAFDHWNETTYAIGGGRDNAERFRALRDAVEKARALVEKQS